MKILIIILAVTLMIMFLAILLVIHMDKNKQNNSAEFSSLFGILLINEMENLAVV